jgi:twinkle protein
MLFGQNLFQAGGKYITILEGEIDAISGFEASGSRWANVSIGVGAQCVANIKANLEWLDSFETVVICFDNDEVGRESALRVAPLLGPNKCKILTLAKYKDVSD